MNSMKEEKAHWIYKRSIETIMLSPGDVHKKNFYVYNFLQWSNISSK